MDLLPKKQPERKTSRLESKSLRDHPVIMAAFEASGGGPSKPVYLVGGVIRNILLSRALPADYDFVSSADIKKLSERFALKAGGSAFLLDKEAPSYRVAFKIKGAAFTADFSPIAGRSIEGDLKKIGK